MLENLSVPETVKSCLASLHEHYRVVLGENLRGIYVHGSIAMGCFNPASSDIDVLVVVNDALSLDMKKQLGEIHLKLSEECTSPIELSVILEDVLENFVYPTPFEFHYSDDHIETFRHGTIDLTTPRTDPDLAAHFVITKKYGVSLSGESAQNTFPDVPPENYLDSIAKDAEWSYNNIMAGGDEGECRVPTYGVLNFCRVLAFIDDQQITSKRSGGEWALAHLPDAYKPVIQEALNEYTLTGSSKPVDCRLLKRFAAYAYENKILPVL